MDPGTGLAIFGSALGGAKLLDKILGPTADYLGEGLKNLAEKAVNNCTRIFVKAKEKLGDRIEQNGAVPPKVLKGIIQEGAFCDDELTAEYFGGVLASSRSEVSRDDRGASFISLISRLSSYQIRSHFVIYHILKKLYLGTNLRIGRQKNREKIGIFISHIEFDAAMEFSEKESSTQILPHVMWGLYREGLITAFTMGRKDQLREFWKDADTAGIIFQPSAFGVELFCWAHGRSDIPTNDFLSVDVQLPLKIKISIPQNAQKIPLPYPPGE